MSTISLTSVNPRYSDKYKYVLDETPFPVSKSNQECIIELTQVINYKNQGYCDFKFISNIATKDDLMITAVWFDPNQIPFGGIKLLKGYKSWTVRYTNTDALGSKVRLAACSPSSGDSINYSVDDTLILVANQLPNVTILSYANDNGVDYTVAAYTDDIPAVTSTLYIDININERFNNGTSKDYVVNLIMSEGTNSTETTISKSSGSNHIGWSISSVSPSTDYYYNYVY